MSGSSLAWPNWHETPDSRHCTKGSDPGSSDQLNRWGVELSSQGVDKAKPDGAVSSSPQAVFISYRPEGTTGVEDQLYEQLAERLGADRVFFEHPGLARNQTPDDQSAWEAWRVQAASEPAGPVFIALIGPRWIAALADLMTDPERGDWDQVFDELDGALRDPTVRVIPILVGGVAWPKSSDLPPALRPLPTCHGPSLRADHLAADIDDHLIPQLMDFAARLPEDDPAAAGDERREPQPAPVAIALPPDETHYRQVMQGLANLVVYLGFEANADDHPGPWSADSGFPPDDRDLATYLARRSEMDATSPDLATVAQYYHAVRSEELYSSLRSSLRLAESSRPGPVHRLLASLPKRLASSGVKQRFQMIVTPKYDAALERAFRDAGEPFDIAVYVAPHEEDGYMVRGAFVHLPWTGPPSPVIDEPNKYNAFPIRVEADGDSLQRTIIVRVNGAVDDDLEQFPTRNYVITEDDYIDYLGGRPAKAVVPFQILKILNRSAHLFLGYRLSDWRLRVFLRLIRKGPRVASGECWAVERAPDILEREFWKQATVELRQCDLPSYLKGLHDYIAANPHPSGP